MFILLGFICLIFCLCISSWISASEIAITSLSQVRVKKLIVQKPKLADALLEWLKSPYYLLSLILTINVVADMLFSFFSTFVMTQAFNMINRHIVEFSAWIISSLIIIIAGEITPKIYARMHSERISIFSVRILSKIGKILKPFLYPIIKLTEFISPKTSAPSSYELSREEAVSIITEGGATGELDKDTSAMLKKTLGFGDLSVKKIMQPIDIVETVDFNLPDELFLDKVIETSRSRIPVYNGNKRNIVGYIHIKDILWAWQAGKKQFVKDLIKPLYFISENKKINELLKEFQCGKTHIAFIKNALGEISGFVSLEDILEEIVGEIVDEYELKK
ncbi:MAG: hemolysin family protein [Elusimicrobiota bacterium]|jgi:CBS domain containing-hemolysin-like protein|nr:hemolysin family protein [Elusimicrobiota bacterium]